MSEQQSVDLQTQSQIKGLFAQLEAAKQMVNEGLQTSLQLRATLHIFQADNKDLARQKETMQKQIDMHKAQIVELSKKVLELQPTLTPPAENPEPEQTQEYQVEENPEQHLA
jgi:hypothetical protein